ncbi:AHH domain-containing protein [Streptomyces sp. NPDC005406]|uniref:AHH domain-containing protein n=1 Tax=Streptomyces sp. NPDC005406 TaxID=3155339 RepID=UPI003455C014
MKATGTAPPTAVTAAGRGTAYRRVHLPESVSFSGDRQRFPYEALLEVLLLRAVADAMDEDDREGRLAGPAPPADQATPGALPEATSWELTGAAAAPSPGEATTEGESPAVGEAKAEGGATATPGAGGHSALTLAVAAPDGEGAQDAKGATTGPGEHGEAYEDDEDDEDSGDGEDEVEEQAEGRDHEHELGEEETGPRAGADEANDGATQPARAQERSGSTQDGADTAQLAGTGGDAPATVSRAASPASPAPGSGAGETGAETESVSPGYDPEADAGVTVVEETRTGLAPRTQPQQEAAADARTGDPAAADDVVTDTRDEVVEGPSPVDGRAVMVIGATQLVMLGEATRHARSRSLVHAVQIGDHIFGARSFAVLEGPIGTKDSRHWAVATAPTVTDEVMGRELSHWEYEGQKISTFKGSTVLPVITTLDGHRYAVQLLWTKERGWLYGSKEAGKRWVRLSRTQPEYLLDRAQLRALAFRELDPLVDAALAGNDDSLEKAATQLGEMDAKAFALVDEKTKEKYLRVLVKAWTFEEQRHAIVEIMKSLDSMAELLTVRDQLIQHGLYEQLFADMGNDLWSLLIEVGKKFGDHKPLAMGEFLRLVTEAFNLGTDRDATLKRTVEEEETAVPDLKLLIDFEESARAVTGFVLSTLDSIKMMLTQPEKVLSGLYQLGRLQYICHRARYGDKKAQAELRDLVHHIGDALSNGLRGAALLGVGPRAMARIKWAVIIEALTWITEIKAVVESLVKIERIAAVLRFLKLLRATDAELFAARFTRLASALHGSSTVLRGLKDEHEVADLLRLLPEEDGARLGAVLSEVEVPKGSTLASLVEHPRLGPVVTDLQRKAEVLHVLGLKSGGLTPELAQVFGRLIGKDGFEIAEVGKVAVALKEGEGGRFAHMLEQIGPGRIGAKGEVKADLLATLAAEPRRMEAVGQYGIGIVQEMHTRAGGKAEEFDAMLVRLEKIRTKEITSDNAVKFSEFLDKLRRGGKGAWQKVAPPPRPPRVKVPRPPRVKVSAADRAPVLDRIKELRERFPKSKVKDPKAMEAALEQIKRINRTDPAKAMEHLERFEDKLKDLASKEGQIAADIAEAETKASKEARTLHHEPDEVPPEALGVRDELRSKLSEVEEASRALAENMAAIGQHQPYGHDAHHIVAWTDRRAGPAREILEWAGVNPRDDPLNGIYLPRTSGDPDIIPQALTRHQTLHTDNYYKEVTRRLVEARKEGGKEGVIREMTEIKKDLINGWKDPGPVSGTKGAKAPKGTKAPKDTKAPKGATSTKPRKAKKQNYADWFEEYSPHLDWLTEEERREAIEKATRPPGTRKKKKKKAPAAPEQPAPTETAPSAKQPAQGTPSAPAGQGTPPGQGPGEALGEFAEEAPKQALKRLPQPDPDKEREDDQGR